MTESGVFTHELSDAGASLWGAGMVRENGHWDTSLAMFLPTRLPVAGLHSAPTSPVQYWYHFPKSGVRLRSPKISLLPGRDTPLCGRAKFMQSALFGVITMISSM